MGGFLFSRIDPNTLQRDLPKLDKQGLIALNREEAMVKRLMMERAQERIVLADSHKLSNQKINCFVRRRGRLFGGKGC